MCTWAAFLVLLSAHVLLHWKGHSWNLWATGRTSPGSDLVCFPFPTSVVSTLSYQQVPTSPGHLQDRFRVRGAVSYLWNVPTLRFFATCIFWTGCPNNVRSDIIQHPAQPPQIFSHYCKDLPHPVKPWLHPHPLYSTVTAIWEFGSDNRGKFGIICNAAFHSPKWEEICTPCFEPGSQPTWVAGTHYYELFQKWVIWMGTGNVELTSGRTAHSPLTILWATGLQCHLAAPTKKTVQPKS